jgi:succinate dehydrogenase flavin-adding protein (antitoxin of CptAB toxin-antitoxin module)
MKLDTDIIQHIVKQNVTDTQELAEIIKAIEQAIAEEEALKVANKAKKDKKKLVAVQLEDNDSVYLLSAKEEFDTTTLVDIIRTKVAVDFNTSPKGQKHPVGNLAEAFEFVANKFWKDYDLSVRTKTPLDIVRTENKLK